MLAPLMLLVVMGAPEAKEGPPRVLQLNRRWDALPAPKGNGPQGKGVDVRSTLKAAAARLDEGGEIEIAGVKVDRALLEALAAVPDEEPLTRAARERMRRPVDVEDLAYFLDDVIAQEATETGPVVLTPHRARRIGVFLHPHDVYKNRPRRYGKITATPIDPPVEDKEWPPPPDGAVLGPEWHGRYPNPDDEAGMIAALAEARPESDFAARVQSLLVQLRAQGATVFVESTLRHRERGYLMYGAFWLSRAKNRRQLERRVRALESLQKEHKLAVPIRWSHPDGWEETKRQARRMAEAYQVVYATRSGALRSNHYDAEAVDISVFGLPRSLTLVAPDGAKKTFDLSGPEEARDLSLSPPVVRWIEEHFGLQKLEGDYPHWNDARR